MDSAKSTRITSLIIAIIATMFLAAPAWAQSLEVCETPTRVYTPSPMPTLSHATLTPFPTPTPYTVSVALPGYADIISYTNQLTALNESAYDYIVSSTLTVSDTAIAIPVAMVKALVSINSFLAAIIGALLAYFAYRFFFSTTVTVVRSSSSIGDRIRAFLRMIAPSWQELAIIALVLGTLYACNRVF